MSPLCIIMAVLLVIVIILLIPVGVEAEYGEPGVTFWLRIGGLRMVLYPRPPKPEGKKKQNKEKKKKEEEPEGEKTKKGGDLKFIMELVHIGVEALGKLKRALLIKKLRLYFCFGGEDPAKAALSFGGASAGAGMLVPLLQSNFRIKEMDIRSSVDFTASGTRVYAHADIRIRPIAAIAIAAVAGVKLLKVLIKKKTAKAEQPEPETQKGK